MEGTGEQVAVALVQLVDVEGVNVTVAAKEIAADLGTGEQVAVALGGGKQVARALCGDAKRPQLDPEVTAHAPRVEEATPPQVVDARCTSTGEHGHGIVPPEERRREVDDIAVHQSSTVESVRDAGATFDQDLEHLPSTQLVEHGTELTTK